MIKIAVAVLYGWPTPKFLHDIIVFYSRLKQFDNNFKSLPP